MALRLLAVGKDGNVRDTRSMILNMPTAGYRHVRAVSQLTLRPGEYRLRVAAIADEIPRGGSVHYDLVVPDLRRKPFAISGPMLSSQATTAVATAFAPADVATALDFVPTTARSYTAHDELVVRNDVYLNERRARNTIALTIQIEAASGETITTFREELPSSETSDHVPVVTRVPLRTLSPGLYRLVVETSSAIRPGNSEVREVPFVIVE